MLYENNLEIIADCFSRHLKNNICVSFMCVSFSHAQPAKKLGGLKICKRVHVRSVCVCVGITEKQRTKNIIYLVVHETELKNSVIVFAYSIHTELLSWKVLILTSLKRNKFGCSYSWCGRGYAV